MVQGGSVISVNVGGKIFQTTASTLRQAPFFESLLSDWTSVVAPNNDQLFVDRPSELFECILEFLRTGRWLLYDNASNPSFIDALAQEATFYGIASEKLPLPRICEYATVWHFVEDSTIYVDCLEQTLRTDPEHQGLFKLCKYSGGWPLDQQTCTKRFKATAHSVQSVISYFASRGFRLQHVVKGAMVVHVTSASGQHRSGPGVQYILSSLSALPPAWMSPMESTRLTAQQTV